MEEDAMPKKKLPRKSGRTGYRLAVFVAMIGVLGSVYLGVTRRRSEDVQVAAAFRIEADSVLADFRRSLKQYFDVLDTVGHLHSLSPDVRADIFNEFVQKGMLYQQRILGVFGLAPRIDGADRAPYEAAMRRQIRPDFSMVEWSGERWVPAAQRPLYFPVSYLAPDRFQDLPVGFDLGSNPENAEAMLKAVGQKGAWAGGRVYGKQGTGRLFFSPIQSLVPEFRNGRSTGNFAYGYAFAMMYPSELIAQILEPYTPRGIQVEVTEERDGQSVRLYPEASDECAREETLVLTEPLDLNGLNWTVKCTASRAFVEQRRTLMPWMYLAVGGLLTLVVVGQIVQLVGRSERIRNLVSERTRELEHEIRQRHELQRQIIDISTQEKKRIGRDLHDSLGQQLTGIGLLTSALAKRLDQLDQPEEAGQARHVAELLKEARAGTRRMAHGLTPVELDVEALPEALERLVEEVRTASGINCMFEWWGKLDQLDNDQAVNLYHIAQEALNNAVRHAHAKNIRVELGSDLLKISDDGVGLPERGTLSSHHGLGLKIMLYRAETAGGRLEINSGPDHHGVTVLCTFGVGEAMQEKGTDGI